MDAGTPELAGSSAVHAWLADTLSGRSSVLVVGSNEEAARLSAEIRTELVRLGRVAEDGVPLGRDGTTAAVGDLVQARRNAWDLVGWEGNRRAPVNRETYRVVAVCADGGLVVEDGRGRLALPRSYVGADLTLGYAGTAHSTQGRTVDTSHVVVGARTGMEALYVGMSRGRLANHAHVVTDPVDEGQPVGAAHQVERMDPLGVLTGILAAEPDLALSATAQAEEAEARRKSTQTAIERFAAEAEMVYTARTAGALDRLAADGTLTANERLTFAAESTDTGALARLLRTAELAGHDPDRVLGDAVRSRSFDGARSLPQVVYRRIERQLEGRLAPTVLRFGEMIPAVVSPGWQRQLGSYAESADARRSSLGAAAAEDPPQWAVEAMGEVPADTVARLEWEHRAGAVAAWRELSGHADPADALGTAPPPTRPEHYATWRAAWHALGRPDADRADAELSSGQLRMRVRAYEREKAWAPAYVGESLTATSLAAGARRRTAVLTAARADAAPDAADAERLRLDALGESVVADALDRRLAELEEADRARAAWLAHTAVTRDAAQRAEAELATRGVPVGAGGEDAVTAEEWLAAHRAEQAAEDVHRPITAEHDLADNADEQLPVTNGAETALPDARDTVAVEMADEPGRIPAADETREAVRRAQAALLEIEQRRALDDRRAREEQQAAQWHQWAADDAATRVVDRADAATY